MHILHGLNISLFPAIKPLLSNLVMCKVYTDIGGINYYTNFSMKYLVMCKVYTDVGGIK